MIRSSSHSGNAPLCIYAHPEALPSRSVQMVAAVLKMCGVVALFALANEIKSENNKHNSGVVTMPRRQLVLFFLSFLISLSLALACCGCCFVVYFIWLSLFVAEACSHNAVTNAMGNSTCCECRSAFVPF